MKYLLLLACAILVLSAKSYDEAIAKSLKNGGKLYKKACASCHGKKGLSLPPGANFAMPIIERDEIELIAILNTYRDGGADSGGAKGTMAANLMRYKFSDQDIEDIAHYVASLNPNYTPKPKTKGYYYQVAAYKGEIPERILKQIAKHTYLVHISKEGEDANLARYLIGPYESKEDMQKDKALLTALTKHTHVQKNMKPLVRFVSQGHEIYSLNADFSLKDMLGEATNELVFHKNEAMQAMQGVEAVAPMLGDKSESKGESRDTLLANALTQDEHYSSGDSLGIMELKEDFIQSLLTDFNTIDTIDTTESKNAPKSNKDAKKDAKKGDFTSPHIELTLENTIMQAQDFIPMLMRDSLPPQANTTQADTKEKIQEKIQDGAHTQQATQDDKEIPQQPLELRALFSDIQDTPQESIAEDTISSDSLKPLSKKKKQNIKALFKSNVKDNMEEHTGEFINEAIQADSQASKHENALENEAKNALDGALENEAENGMESNIENNSLAMGELWDSIPTQKLSYALKDGYYYILATYAKDIPQDTLALLKDQHYILYAKGSYVHIVIGGYKGEKELMQSYKEALSLTRSIHTYKGKNQKPRPVHIHNGTLKELH